MAGILHAPTTEAVVVAIEENLYSVMPNLQRWPRAEVHDTDEIMWSITDVPFPLFNSVMRAQLDPTKVESAIQHILGQAKSRNVPVLWWIGPSTQPADLAERLMQHGFTRQGEMPGMAIDLAGLRGDPRLPAGLRITMVRDPAALEDWVEAFASSFDMPESIRDSFGDFVQYSDLDRTVLFAGYQYERPVATALLKLEAGVAGLYNVGTAPEARRQGIGAAMTYAALMEARRKGYRVAILHSSEIGEGVYRSLGFREYCRIGQYIWSP